MIILRIENFWIFSIKFFFAALFILLFYSSVNAAILEILSESKFGNWNFAVYRNANTFERFCAVETYSADKTVFRIAYYEENKFFFEVYSDSKYINCEECYIKFGNNVHYVIDRNSADDGYISEDPTTFRFGVLREHIEKNRWMRVLSAGTDEVIAKFSLVGATKALQEFDQCKGEI